MKAMELKVWVDGVQRVVCGVTEFTTCQEVVIALAQAIGKIATKYLFSSCFEVQKEGRAVKSCVFERRQVKRRERGLFSRAGGGNSQK